MKYDFLIIGQGLAGSLLYYELAKRGKKVLVIDHFNPSSASNIAPGIIHPITGRRIVKTWMADTLIPFVENTYREIETGAGETFFHKKNILELISTVKEQNDWSVKSCSDELKDYFGKGVEGNLYNDVLANNFTKIEISNSGWLDVAGLVKYFRNELLKDGKLIEDKFKHADLIIKDNEINYKGFVADKIIFCEGYRSSRNPYWKNLPFLLSKGEVLTIRSEQLQLNHILSRTISILPVGENLYKVGSTYEWDELNETLTESAKEKLLDQLKKIINVPFEIVGHQAGIRPTVKERRPLIGLHPEYPRVGIFNGMGTKGVLMAPYFANHFAEFLDGKTELLNEVDVKRFF